MRIKINVFLRRTFLVLMFVPYFSALLMNLVGSWLVGVCTSSIAKFESWLPIHYPAPPVKAVAKAVAKPVAKPASVEEVQ
jgi:hypothetical protein